MTEATQRKERIKVKRDGHPPSQVYKSASR
jgi:hypothetical protein